MFASDPASFRPVLGRWLTAGFAVVCGIAAIGGLFSDGPSAMYTLWPGLMLLTGLCWAFFWRPEVRADDHGVTLVNVTHTVEVPWPALIGLETKWALSLVTVDRTYRAWAAPAPGRSAMRREERNTHSVRDAAIGGEIRPGDLPETDSGAAAILVRKHWRAKLESGALDEGDGSDGDVRLFWHWAQVGVGAALIALVVVGLV